MMTDFQVIEFIDTAVDTLNTAFDQCDAELDRTLRGTIARAIFTLEDLRDNVTEGFYEATVDGGFNSGKAVVEWAFLPQELEELVTASSAFAALVEG